MVTPELNLNNDVNLLAAQPEVAPGDDPNGAILFNDIDDLAIDTVSVTVNADTWTVTGITSDADLKLRVGTEIAGPDVPANLVINQAINLGTGSLYLDVDGNVTQTAPGTITADGLALIVDGYTELDLNNDVNLLAAQPEVAPGDDPNGAILFNDIDDLAIDTVSVTVNADTWTVTGITSDADLKLRVGTEIAGPDVLANLVINQAINLGTGSLYLDVDGNVTQTAPGTITADGLALIVDGYTELNLNNDVNLLAAQPEVAPGDDPNGAILFNDIDDLAIDTVSVTVNADTWTVTGITSDADLKLRVGTEIAGPDVPANLMINQAINLGTGSLYLDVDGNVTQTAPGTITADGLALIVDGYTELDLNNDVNLLAAQPEVAPGDDPNGAILFNDIDDLAIDTVSVTVNADTWTVCGLNIGGDLSITLVDATLSQAAAAIVGGDAVLRVVDGADANTTVDGDICLTGADCDQDDENPDDPNNPDFENDNDFMGLVTASARTVEIVDSNDLRVGAVTAELDIRLGAGDGVENAAGAAQTGQLRLFGDLTTTDAAGQILLQSDGGVLQDSTSSVIQTNDLMLQGTTDDRSMNGSWELQGANLVNNLAAGNVGEGGPSPGKAIVGDLTFVNSADLRIEELAYESLCTVAAIEFEGIQTRSFGGSNGNITLMTETGADHDLIFAADVWAVETNATIEGTAGGVILFENAPDGDVAELFRGDDSNNPDGRVRPNVSLPGPQWTYDTVLIINDPQDINDPNAQVTGNVFDGFFQTISITYGNGEAPSNLERMFTAIIEWANDTAFQDVEFYDSQTVGGNEVDFAELLARSLTKQQAFDIDLILSTPTFNNSIEIRNDANINLFQFEGGSEIVDLNSDSGTFVSVVSNVEFVGFVPYDEPDPEPVITPPTFVPQEEDFRDVEQVEEEVGAAFGEQQNAEYITVRIVEDEEVDPKAWQDEEFKDRVPAEANPENIKETIREEERYEYGIYRLFEIDSRTGERNEIETFEKNLDNQPLALQMDVDSQVWATQWQPGVDGVENSSDLSSDEDKSPIEIYDPSETSKWDAALAEPIEVPLVPLEASQRLPGETTELPVDSEPVALEATRQALQVGVPLLSSALLAERLSRQPDMPNHDPHSATAENQPAKSIGYTKVSRRFRQARKAMGLSENS
jgi:hypothetical protein